MVEMKVCDFQGHKSIADSALISWIAYSDGSHDMRILKQLRGDADGEKNQLA